MKTSKIKISNMQINKALLRIPFLKSNLSRQTSENVHRSTLSESNKDRLFLRIGITTFLSFATLSHAKDGYLVILESFKQPNLQQAKMVEKQFNAVKQHGFKPYFIKTDDYPPLKQGLWAMVLGEYDKTTAKSQQHKVKQWVNDAYVRKVQLPTMQTMNDQLAYRTSYFNIDNCFTIWEEMKQEGAGGDYCVGSNGYHVDTTYGDARAYLNINGKEFQGENWMGSEEFPYFDPAHPITWIYAKSNAKKPIAMSFALSTSDENGNHESHHYLIKINGDKFTPVKRKFPLNEFSEMAEYLHK